MHPDARVLLLGDPVSRSLSPAMQNAAFQALGIDCQYVLAEVDRAGLGGAIAELRGDERILGANVTIPHKESVIALLDDLDPQAARIGAVNTIRRQGARLKGWNTDVEGFRRALAETSPSPRVGEISESPSPLGGGGGGGGGAPSHRDHRGGRSRAGGCCSSAARSRSLGYRAQSRSGATPVPRPRDRARRSD